MALSITGYDHTGEARVYGRGVYEGNEVPQAIAEEVAMRNARKQATWYIRDHPESGPIERWAFRVDTVDRQLFQPARQP